MEINDEDARMLYLFARRLRDRLAREINQGGSQAVQQTAGEFQAVCALLNQVKPLFHPEHNGPPAGQVDRRGQVH